MVVLADLPQEILIEILKYLDPESLVGIVGLHEECKSACMSVTSLRLKFIEERKRLLEIEYLSKQIFEIMKQPNPNPFELRCLMKIRERLLGCYV
ncbi:hypothetical protein Trydic_g22755 [Trypoxylus dichotomus]